MKKTIILNEFFDFKNLKMLENNILLLNGITCIYNNSIENTEKFANYDINKSILNKIKNEQQKYVLHKNIKSIKSQLYVLRRKYG